MDGLPVTQLEVKVAANGGQIRLTTNDGVPFASPLFPIPFITAIATIMAGPNPHFDHAKGIFSCGFEPGLPLGGHILALSHLSQPIEGDNLFEQP